MKTSLLLVLALLSLTVNRLDAGSRGGEVAPEAIKILTIGNSFSQNACKYLPEIAASAGQEIIITRAAIGGASLEKHASLIAACQEDSTLKPYADKYTLQELLGQDQYDYVTIQQVSSSSFKPESYQPHADILIDFIREHAPSAEIIVHQTWAYSPTCERLANWDLARDEMHEGLVRSYELLAEEGGFEILPSGNAFYQSFEERPELYLWSDDGYHANENGCYLAGCVWFGKLFATSPQKVSYVPEELDPDAARFLRGVAEEVSQPAHAE